MTLIMKELYLAGGCFWGMQAYFENIPGVVHATVGYANGHVEHPTYDMVCLGNTGYAETIYITYDEKLVDLVFLLSMYFLVIDPTSFHRQGGDIGSQYRTGIYYCDNMDQEIIQAELTKLQTNYQLPVVVECAPLHNFYPAEDYHQNYLKKHPNGYCHIPKKKIEEAKFAKKN